MSSFLKNLTARALGSAERVMPRHKSIFEPVKPGLPSLAANTGDASTGQSEIADAPVTATPQQTGARLPIQTGPTPVGERNPENMLATITPQPERAQSRHQENAADSSAAKLPAESIRPPEQRRTRSEPMVPIDQSVESIRAVLPVSPQNAHAVTPLVQTRREAGPVEPPRMLRPIRESAEVAFVRQERSPRSTAPESQLSDPHFAEENSPVVGPIVRIHIDRIDVRATSPAPAATANRPPGAGPRVTLENYLKTRSSGT